MKIKKGVNKIMKNEYTIRIDNQKDQIEFSKICRKFDFDINLCKGSYEVDAKSVLGVCSMDTSSGCYVRICSNVSKEKLENFKNQIKRYIK